MSDQPKTQCCRRIPLADDGFCRVEAHGRDHVHVHLGPITVRIAREAFADVMRTLSEAERVMRQTTLTHH